MRRKWEQRRLETQAAGTPHAYRFGFYSKCPTPLLSQGKTQPQPCCKPWACPSPPPPNLLFLALSVLDFITVLETGRTSLPPGPHEISLIFFFLPDADTQLTILEDASESTRISSAGPSASPPCLYSGSSSVPLAASTLHQCSLEGGRVTLRCPPDC